MDGVYSVGFMDVGFLLFFGSRLLILLAGRAYGRDDTTMGCTVWSIMCNDA